MNLWGRKCSPRPTPSPSWLLPSKRFKKQEQEGINGQGSRIQEKDTRMSDRYGLSHINYVKAIRLWSGLIYTIERQVKLYLKCRIPGKVHKTDSLSDLTLSQTLYSTKCYRILFCLYTVCVPHNSSLLKSSQRDAHLDCLWD